MSEILDKAREELDYLDEIEQLKRNKAVETLKALNKLEQMEKTMWDIYNAYHHGTEEELNKSIVELIHNEEKNWSDEE